MDYDITLNPLISKRTFVKMLEMSNSMAGLPNIFEYDNYRKFLNDAYHGLKALNKKFSFRYFARVCGFSSHSFLQLIMQGKSNLSPESIDKIVKAFKLNQEQSQFFRNLVHLNQATTSEEKQHFAKEILKSRTYRQIHPLSETQYQYYSTWYYAVVREIVALPGFIEDTKWIAEHTIPKIKPEEAQKAIDSLLKLKLLKRDENGRLVQSEAVVSTPAEVSSAYVANWHKQYLKKAAESIDIVAREKRDISAVTLGFSQENIKIIKEMVANFRRELVEVAIQNPGRNTLYQLNIQFFPLTESTEEDES